MAVSISSAVAAVIPADMHRAEELLSQRKGADMDKHDIKKAHKELYAPTSKTFALIDVPAFAYIAVDGHGDPNTSSEYSAAIEALYAVAYTIKFISKNALGRLHDEFMPEHGLAFNGDHHEIYLSDARKTAPAKLRTILRQPVRLI